MTEAIFHHPSIKERKGYIKLTMGLDGIHTNAEVDKDEHDVPPQLQHSGSGLGLSISTSLDSPGAHPTHFGSGLAATTNAATVAMANASLAHGFEGTPVSNYSNNNYNHNDNVNNNSIHFIMKCTERYSQLH